MNLCTGTWIDLLDLLHQHRNTQLCLSQSQLLVFFIKKLYQAGFHIISKYADVIIPCCDSVSLLTELQTLVQILDVDPVITDHPQIYPHNHQNRHDQLKNQKVQIFLIIGTGLQNCFLLHDSNHIQLLAIRLDNGIFPCHIILCFRCTETHLHVLTNPESDIFQFYTELSAGKICVQVITGNSFIILLYNIGTVLICHIKISALHSLFRICKNIQAVRR